MGLSKSRYTLFRQCLKALWMRVHKPELAVVDPSVEARFASGNEVGDLAMGLFGDFVEVTAHTEGGLLDLGTMLQKTMQCIADGAENIAEASFSFDGNYCAVDILHKEGHGYAIYEVKSSSHSDSEEVKAKDVEKYAWDIAYQKWVLTQCGVNVTGTYLVRLNKDYRRHGDLDIQELFVITDMSEFVETEYPKVPGNVAIAKRMLEKPEPEREIGSYCKKPYECAFWQYCSRHLPAPEQSVFGLYRMSFATALKHYRNGIETLEQATEIKLTAMQQLQLSASLSHKTYVNKQGIRQFLKKLSYPLYFLDFETMQSALPKYEGTKPYQQITFQYSLHWIEEEGGKLHHTAFLAEPGGDPRRALAEQICKDIPLDVCTTAYNKNFECSRLNELADAYPDLAYHLRNISEHIVDLIDPFRAGDYYVPAMNGSFSIKKVLPALFPNDPSLDYHNLTGGVQNGGDAMDIFPKMEFMSPEDRAHYRQALLEYCGLDTYAMVKVWEKLREVSI